MVRLAHRGLVIAVAVSSVLGLMGPAAAFAVTATAPDLGTASTFSVLGVTISAAASTTVSGDLGFTTNSTPTTWTSTGGTSFTGGAQAGAVSAATAAWNTMSSSTSTGGTTWLNTNISPAPGLWTVASDITFNNTLTLTGSATDVWVFQIGSSLTFTGTVVLTGGAQACNVFWRTELDATINSGGASSTFVGTLIAGRDLSTVGGVTVDGRLLALRTLSTAGVTNIVNPTCVTPGAAPVVTVSQGSGGVPPLIDLLKTPSPLILPFGGGPVVYTYKVKNIGTVQMRFVNLTDDHCPSQNMKFVSSDKKSLLTNVDSSSWLAVGETWTYTCALNLAGTTQNIATVTGHANGVQTKDVAAAIVTVGIPLVPPLIHVVKVPSTFLLPAWGGVVTYSYSVTNPGVVPLDNVSIVDDKCTGLPGRVVGHPGDINKNNLLDPSETFYFTCQTNIWATVTNLATAQGSGNGLTVTDFAFVTVVVAPPVVTPMLPNTGFPPEGNGTPWGLVLFSGILAAVSASAVLILKKRKA